MLWSWMRTGRLTHDAEVCRRLATLADALAKADLRRRHDCRAEVFDITDLDELQCRQLWPEHAGQR